MSPTFILRIHYITKHSYFSIFPVCDTETKATCHTSNKNATMFIRSLLQYLLTSQFVFLIAYFLHFPSHGQFSLPISSLSSDTFLSFTGRFRSKGTLTKKELLVHCEFISCREPDYYLYRCYRFRTDLCE